MALHVLMAALLASSPLALAQDDDDAAASPDGPQEVDTPARPPNILLVLFDDAGFMDFGAYGSDTSTPNIDRLGRSGAMFSRYYSTPLCGPSRASLLTGQDNHQVGMGTLSECLTPEMHESPAYDMTWEEDQQTIASRLKGAGYQTFVAGKWGIGAVGTNLPHRFGFDRSWVLDATGASNYQEKSYLPLYKEVKWFEDGERTHLPDDYYSSRDIVNKMIQYTDEANPDQPFFGFLSLQAVHMPVQAPMEFINKYDGVFDKGWEVMREERLQRAIELGLVPKTTTLSDGAYNDRSWDDLSASEKAYWARAMQVNAGMMEAADHHLGRLVDHLEAKGILDDTLIIVTSDNGPEYNTIGQTSHGGMLAFERTWMAVEGWEDSLENMGQRNSMTAIGHEWASVSAAPFHLFKFNASEGGLRVPMMVTGPGIDPRGFVDERAQVSDIAPTLMDVAGVDYDPAEFHGRSWMPMLWGEAEQVYADSDSFAFETGGTAALYRGKWKITKTPSPYGDDAWHLYDLSVDPGETNDVKGAHPDLFAEMLAEYEVYADEVGVWKLAPGESARAQLSVNAIKKSAKNYWHLAVGAALVPLTLLAGLGWLLVSLLRRRTA